MKHLVDEELKTLLSQKARMVSHLNHLKRDFDYRVTKIEEASAKVDELQGRVLSALESYKSYAERVAKAELKRAQAEIESLKKQLKDMEPGETQPESLTLKKATTLGIFDAILFQLYNWSNSGDTASDFEMMSQAVLFPSVYERVMDGDNEAYFLDKVPDSALDVVNLGREFIKKQRKENGLSLSSPTVWKQYMPIVSDWWLNEALPLLYDGAKDPSWEFDEPYSQQEMVAWRDFPAGRPLAFPKICDGESIADSYSSKYMDQSGIPEFTRESMELRIDPV